MSLVKYVFHLLINSRNDRNVVQQIIYTMKINKVSLSAYDDKEIHT